MPNPDNRYSRELITILHGILAKNPDGLTEHELLTQLATAGLAEFATAGLHTSLSIFQIHFLLFHHLYLLRQQLRSEKEHNLAIHCLRIALIPAALPPESSALDHHDPMQSYYLDWDNMENTGQEEVDALLESFWRRYCTMHQRPKALRILGLAAEATDREITMRYRQLALTHHPDRGGCPKRFLEISEAVTILRDQSAAADTAG